MINHLNCSLYVAFRVEGILKVCEHVYQISWEFFQLFTQKHEFQFNYHYP